MRAWKYVFEDDGTSGLAYRALVELDPDDAVIDFPDFDS
jgi:hypothetical protein